MLQLSDFTSADEVRTLLGLSDDELEDGQVLSDLCAMHLARELQAVSLALETDYLDNKDFAADGNERVFVEAVRMFATHSVATLLAGALPLLAPKTVTDGKASYNRFAEAPFKTVMDTVNRGYLRARKELQAAYANFTGVVVTAPTAFSGLRSSAPIRNPITGEGF